MSEIAITERLQELAGEAGDEDLVYWLDDGTSTTYGELHEVACRWAELLVRMGIRAEDRVAIMSSSGRDFLGAHFGAQYAGAVVVPISVELRGASLGHPLKLYGPRVLIVDEDLENLAREAMKDIDAPVIVTVDPRGVRRPRWDQMPALGDTAGQQVARRPARLSDTCLIMSTSGTTGPPKGSAWTYGTLWQWCATYIQHLDYSPLDRIYCCTPLTHANALVAGVCTAIYAECSVAIADRFSVSRFWEDVSVSGATTANILGSMIHLLLKEGGGQRAAVSGPLLRTMLVSSCTAAAYRRVTDEWHVHPVCAYGLTDFGNLTISTVGEACPPGSCGRAVEDFEVRLVASDDEEVPRGAAGELIVRPRRPWIAPTGYFRMPEETLRSRRNLWFHTGDILRQDEEGWFYFVGRVKEAMRYRGENVSGFQVESVLLACGEILEAAVYAVPSELGEDEIAAAVVAAEPGMTIDLHELTRRISGELPYFAVPRYIRVLDQLPKNASHRVVKSVLAAEGTPEGTWDRRAAGVEVARNRPRPT